MMDKTDRLIFTLGVVGFAVGAYLVMLSVVVQKLP
jgi:hypothetical protein